VILRRKHPLHLTPRTKKRRGEEIEKTDFGEPRQPKKRRGSADTDTQTLLKPQEDKLAGGKKRKQMDQERHGSKQRK